MIFSILMAANQALAVDGNSVHLTLSLTENGRVIASPTMVVPTGEASGITVADRKYLEVTATKKVYNNQDVIQLDFKFGIVNKLGHRTYTNEKSVMVREEEKTQVDFTTGRGNRYKLDVTAKSLLPY